MNNHIIWLTQTDSTNSYWQERLRRDAGLPDEGSVVVADSQTAGRGQMGTRWEGGEAESLLFSMVLYPHWLSPERQFMLSQAMALGVMEGLAPWLPQTRLLLKYPNDIFTEGDQKLGGMLIENSWLGARWQYAVVGVGINVNQAAFPPHLPTAVSMNMVAAGLTFHRPTVLAEVCVAMSRRYADLREGLLEEIETAYQNALWGKDRLLRYATSAGEVLRGKVLGVSPEGYLRLSTVEGERLFGIKALRWLGDEQSPLPEVD